MKTTFLFLLALALASCETLREERTECGVWLRFVFDHNMEYTDSFARQARTVDVHIFDASGRFVKARHASVEELVDGCRMYIDDLAFGDYKILSVANFTPEHFRLTSSTIEGAQIALIHDGVVDRRFDHLFVGSSVVDVRYDSRRTSYTVPMIRQTNNFHVTLQTLAPGTRAAEPVHTVSIVAPEAGCYNRLNRPTDRRPTTYRPHTLSCDDPRLTSAKLNTMRLLEDEPGGYRISVRGVADGSELWGTDLLPLLSATKPAARPDGTELPCAEYYDRQGEWNIVIVHRAAAPGDPPSGSAFVALRIVVNGWVVWQNPIGI